MTERRSSAFTLVELLLVIVIIGILAGMLLLSSGGAIDLSKKTACLNNRKVIQREYEVLVADPEHANFQQLFSGTILPAHPRIQLVSDGTVYETLKGVCPAGGIVAVLLPDMQNPSEIEISCTLHDGELSDNFIKQLSIILKDIKIIKNGKAYSLENYFNDHQSSNLDSTGKNFGQPFAKKLGDALGIDLSAYSWCVTKNGSSTSYSIYWTATKVNELGSGAALTKVYKYDSTTNDVTTGTAQVTPGKDTTQGKYMTIDPKSFKADS